MVKVKRTVWLVLAMLAAAPLLVHGAEWGISIEGQHGLGKVPDSVSVYTLAPGEIDTTTGFPSVNCERISLVGICDGDSFAYWIDKSADGTRWSSLVDSTFVNATPGDTTATNIAVNVWKELAHLATVGATNTATLSDWMIPYIRVRVHVIDTSDSLKSNSWYWLCGEK